MAASHHEGEGRETTAPQDLLDYLRGQFQDAHLKEVSRDDRGEQAPHGSFWQDRPIEEDHALTRGSEKMVLILPYPREDNTPYEVFALIDKHQDEEDGEPETEPLMSWEADRFLVRSVPRDEPKGAFYLVDESGASRVELDDEEALELFNIEKLRVPPVDIEAQRVSEGCRLLGELSIRNIAALGVTEE